MAPVVGYLEDPQKSVEESAPHDSGKLPSVQLAPLESTASFVFGHLPGHDDLQYPSGTYSQNPAPLTSEQAVSGWPFTVIDQDVGNASLQSFWSESPFAGDDVGSGATLVTVVGNDVASAATFSSEHRLGQDALQYPSGTYSQAP